MRVKITKNDFKTEIVEVKSCKELFKMNVLKYEVLDLIPQTICQVEEVEEVEITNEKSDIILMDVKIKLSEIYPNFNDKYFTIYKDDKTLVLRVSDHTHNLNNGNKNDSCYADKFAYVVIADNDATEKKFYDSITDLRFNSTNNVNEIVNEIVNLVNLKLGAKK